MRAATLLYLNHPSLFLSSWLYHAVSFSGGLFVLRRDQWRGEEVIFDVVVYGVVVDDHS